MGLRFPCPPSVADLRVVARPCSTRRHKPAATVTCTRSEPRPEDYAYIEELLLGRIQTDYAHIPAGKRWVSDP